MKKLYLVRTIILAGSLLLQLSTLCFQSRGSGVNGTVQAPIALATANRSNHLTTPTDNGTTKTVTVNLPTGNRFYRLKNP